MNNTIGGEEIDHLERMNAFDPQVLAADLLEVKRIYAAFFAARSPADWLRHTEPHARGWTLRETIARLPSAVLSQTTRSPFYHLVHSADRHAALCEARRVLRPGVS